MFEPSERLPSTVYERRRRQVLEAMGEGVLIVPASPVAPRNGDGDHPYRASSDLLYLTGLTEPDAVAVLSTVKEPRFVLFMRPRDREREIWEGRRLGVEGAVSVLQADEAHPIGELATRLPDLLEGARELHHRLGLRRDIDDLLLEAMATLRRRARRGARYPRRLLDPDELLHEMRIRKDPEELAVMRAAAAVTVRAHRRLMRAARPGAGEWELEAELRHEFLSGGAREVAYPPIIAAGRNATILHYTENAARLGPDDLVLVDAGCELLGYASDVTRTFPAGRTFNRAQAAAYDVVLEAHRLAVAAVRPGATMDSIHDVAVGALVDGLLDLGLLTGDRAEVLAEHRYRRFYMHRTGHLLGLDVHDVGDLWRDGAPRPLEEGMVVTVEPGLYFAEDDADVPAAFRGIGIRIEDDVRVTSDGREVLTDALERTRADIERLRRGGD